MPTGPRPAPPDDTVRVIIHGTTLGHSWHVIQWLKLTATTRTQADLVSIITSLGSALATEWQSTWLSSTGVTEIVGVWKTPGGGEIIGAPGLGFSGTSTLSSAVDFAGASFVLGWKISAYYRGGHPRNYFPGVQDAHVGSGSAFTGGVISGVNSAAATYLAAINALTHGGITGVQLGTVSFASGGAWRAPPLFRPFVAAVCNPIMGTQRRRLHS